MKLLEASELKNLVGRNEPCVSVYTPLTGDYGTDLRTLQQTLNEASDRARELFPIVAPHFEYISGVRALNQIQHIRDAKGIALFKSALMTGVMARTSPTDSLIVVSDSFHLKPFFNEMQMESAYLAIEINAKNIVVYEGGFGGIRQVNEYRPNDAALPMIEAALNRASTLGDSAQGRVQRLYYDRATLRYFRTVDADIRKRFALQTTQVPIILIGEDRGTALYSGVNKHRSAIVAVLNGLHIDSPDEIHRASMMVLDDFQHRRALRGAYEYRFANSMGRSIDNLGKIAQAAAKGQIKSLLIRSGTKIWGRMNRKTGLFKVVSNLPNIADDLLDDLGELVLKNNGQVFVLSPHEMPTNQPVAAILNSVMRAAS
jgi:hypothetical protein